MKNNLLPLMYGIALISFSGIISGKGGDEEYKTATTSCPEGESTCVAQVSGSGHKTAVVDCGGEGTNCSAVVNAIGDVISVDVSQYPVKALGTIAQEKKATVTLPDNPGTKSVYSIIPSTGESAGKTIHILFDNTAPRPGSKDFGKTVVKIYRQFKGEKPSDWTEVGMITSEEKKLGDVAVTFKTDGTAVWTDPTGKLYVFAIGKLKLKV